jgi:hypothetical protein
VVGGKKHILEHSPYNAVTLYFPGRHAKDTDPIGGDFVVTVDDEDLNWIKHQFTHNDIFADLELKKVMHPRATSLLMAEYCEVVNGKNPAKAENDWPVDMPGLNPVTFLYAVQCLAVAEHRRYAKYEKQGGGRFLPARFALGIVHGAWTALDCANMQRRGRPGVEILEKTHNFPTQGWIKNEVSA